MSDVTAVVPVRGGSRRLKNKNLSPFAGTTLLGFKLQQLLATPSVDRIVVSSDSDEMLGVAQSMGVETHKRAPEFCDDTSKTFPEVVEHVASQVRGSHVLWAFATSPLVMAELFEEAIARYRLALEEGFDSLISVERFRAHLWDEVGSVNYDASADGHALSQDMPPYYVMTEGIFLAPREDMVRWRYFHGASPCRFEIDKWSAIDVNDRLDLECARAWLDRREP